MELTIRIMQPEDIHAKGYVHWKCWKETFPGLVDEAYLAQLPLERFLEIAHRRTDHTYIAELDGRIVGFTSFGPCRDADLPNYGEVYAIYILKEAQGLGLGRKLMDAALEKLSAYDTIALWVLKGNANASGFYEHYGFRFDGIQKDIVIGTPTPELRMILHR